MRRRLMVWTMVAAFLTATLSLPPAAAAQQANPNQNRTVLPISGTVDNAAGTLTGTFAITRFVTQNGGLMAVGTLTALPVRSPERVDARVSRRAVLLAPFAAVPLGVAVAAVLWVCRHFDVADLAAGLAAVGMVMLGTRAFHVDGLADTADGLTASYDSERSLAVMKSGSVGPAGAAFFAGVSLHLGFAVLAALFLLLGLVMTTGIREQGRGG